MFHTPRPVVRSDSFKTVVFARFSELTLSNARKPLVGQCGEFCLTTCTTCTTCVCSAAGCFSYVDIAIHTQLSKNRQPIGKKSTGSRTLDAVSDIRPPARWPMIWHESPVVGGLRMTEERDLYCYMGEACPAVADGGPK